MKAWILDELSRSVLKNLEVCSCCFIFDKFLLSLDHGQSYACSALGLNDVDIEAGTATPSGRLNP